MKKSQFSDEEIAFALKQAELNINVEQACWKMGISDAAFYVRRRKCGGVSPSGLRRLQQFEEENRKRAGT